MLINSSFIFMTSRPLRVFLCHSSADKPAVRELYQKLRAEPWLEPWLDEEELFPGMDWNLEIEKAVESADAIIVCLSKGSITKEGYVQRELRIVLDFADYKPEGTLYLMPVRLEDCEPPRRLRPWQYADYFEGSRERGLQRLLISLKRRADSLGLNVEAPAVKQKEKPVDLKKAVIEKPKPFPVPQISTNQKYSENGFLIEILGGIELVRIPAGKFLMGSDNGRDNEKPKHTVNIPYDYWMARFPVTNTQYSQFKKKDFDKGKEDHPVVNVSWYDAMEYCQRLNKLLKKEFPSDFVLRLPTEAEWEKASRGTDGRVYSWANIFDYQSCNTYEGGKGETTPVWLYSPQGDSPYGCADTIGNVLEWTHSLYKPYPYKDKDGREDEKSLEDPRVLRGGSFLDQFDLVCCTSRFSGDPKSADKVSGFRVVASPVLPS